jgi:hypothetical protein
VQAVTEMALAEYGTFSAENVTEAAMMGITHPHNTEALTPPICPVCGYVFPL